MTTTLKDPVLAIHARITDWTCQRCRKPCTPSDWQAVAPTAGGGPVRVVHPWCASARAPEAAASHRRSAHVCGHQCGAPSEAAPPRTAADEETVRRFIVEQLRAEGKRIPAWLERPVTVTQVARPDLLGTLNQLWQQVLGLDAIVDGMAAAQGKVFVEVPTDEADERAMFAEPTTPWATQLDGPGSIEERYPDAKNPDGDAHGDDAIVRRRRLLELQRKLNAMPFADREGAAGAALRGEIDDLLTAERAERVERNFGTGDSPGGRPTGA